MNRWMLWAIWRYAFVDGVVLTPRPARLIVKADDLGTTPPLRHLYKDFPRPSRRRLGRGAPAWRLPRACQPDGRRDGPDPLRQRSVWNGSQAPSWLREFASGHEKRPDRRRCRVAW